MSTPGQTSQQPHDALVEERVLASGLVGPHQVDLALDVVDALRGSEGELPLVAVLLRRHYLTLSQANYILRDLPERILYCDGCQAHRFVPLADLTIDGICCDTCGMDLDTSPSDVLLAAADLDAGTDRRAGTAAEDAQGAEAAGIDALIGEQVNGYVVEEFVQEGHYAGWYRARDPIHEKDLMLHAIPPQFRRSKDLFMRLREDFYRVKLVNASAKPDAFDLVQLQNNFFVTQAALEGSTVRELVGDGGAMAVEDVIKVMMPVAELAVAGHRQDLIDFDFHPDMILVDSYGRVKVMDVSTGFMASDDVERLRYRAPERIAHKPVNEPADIFSFSAICYFMLTGVAPYPGEDVMEVAEAIMKGACVDIQEAVPNLEPAMVEVVQKGMAVAPSARPKDFKELLDNLRHIPELIRRREAEIAKRKELASRKTKVVSTQEIEAGMRAAGGKRNTGRITAASLKSRLENTEKRVPARPAERQTAAIPIDRRQTKHHFRVTSVPPQDGDPPVAEEAAAAEGAGEERSAEERAVLEAKLQIQEYGKRAREFIKKKRFTLAIKALNRILEFEGKHADFAVEVANARKLIGMLEQQKG